MDMQVGAVVGVQSGLVERAVGCSQAQVCLGKRCDGEWPRGFVCPNDAVLRFEVSRSLLLSLMAQSVEEAVSI